MSLFNPIQTKGGTSELEPSLLSSQLDLKPSPNFSRLTVDPRDHMTFVGRIYQVSGADSADGHYCPFCYDSGGRFVRTHRYADHWQCCVCQAVFYD